MKTAKILLVLLFITTIGIVTIFLLFRNHENNKDNEESQSEQNQDQPTLDKVQKTVGLKYWKQDTDFSYNLTFTLNENYKILDSTLYGQPATQIKLNNGTLQITISHEGSPVHYLSHKELVNTVNSRVFYSVETDEHRLAYTDSLTIKGSCDGISGKVQVPCSTPIYDYLIIECSSKQALTECDEVMQSIVVKKKNDN